MDQNTLKKSLAVDTPLHEETSSKCLLKDIIKLSEQDQALQSLLVQGEMSLLKDDLPSAMNFFEQATRLDSLNASLFFKQGLALLEYGCEEGKERALLQASKKFKQAAKLNADHFECWQAWGHCLYLLAKVFHEHHFFIDSEEKFRHAIALIDKQSPEILGELYWDYSLVRFQLARHSGEALDLQLSLESFQKAASCQENLPPEFWDDFGLASIELAIRINDVRLYVKAINCFKHAISTSASSHESWLHLANALQMLYNHTHDEDHFTQANECFASAAQLKPQDDRLWLNWARFLCQSGRRNRDCKRLRSCVEKCHRAYAYSPNTSPISVVLSEALALMGDFSDRLDLIYESQNIISEAAKKMPANPEVWFSHGICLSSFGRYFNDFDYYYQAIEKFQQGLSIDRTCDRLWHAIAATYSVIGQLESDIEALELANRFYNKAEDLKISSFYLFDHAVNLLKLGEITHEQKWIEQAIVKFERALSIQKNAIYIHPEWLFQYASALDILGDFYEENYYYHKAIEIFSHVLMIDPDFPQIHHRIALAYSHLGELLEEIDHFYKAIHHFRLASKHDEENDQIILDWGLTLVNISQCLTDFNEADQYYLESEHKLIQSAKLGNLHAYYHLGCLHSLMGQYDKAMHFILKADQFESLPSLETIVQDEWLDGLRSTNDFREFLSQLEKKPNLQEER